MPTTIRLSSPDIPVSLPDGLSEESIRSFDPFNRWVGRLTRSLERQSHPSHPFHADPYALRSVEVQSFDTFGAGGRLGFLKLRASVANGAGEALPGSVFLRGPSVAMLVLLVPDDAAPGSAAEAAERRAVLTVQPRVPAGSLALTELPAGMVDDGGAFAGTAAREIEEELGLVIREDQLACLSDLAAAAAGEKSGDGESRRDEEQGALVGDYGEDLPNAMFPSAGGCDEFIPIFMHERRVPRSQLKEWSGKLTGLRDEGEKITLKLVRMTDLWKEGARDAKCLAAVALWEGLKREGKL